jgi:CubicO group peptidase (beta-lactamase class C family)
MKVYSTDFFSEAAQSDHVFKISLGWSLLLAVGLVTLLGGSGCAPKTEGRAPASVPPLSLLTDPSSTPTGSVPVISSYTPNTASVNSDSFVLLTGTGFLPTTQALFGSVQNLVMEDALYVLYLSPTQLLLVTPSWFPGKADFIVYNSSTEYDYRLGGITYQDPPAPVAITNPQPEPGDTLGLYAVDNSIFSLLPAGAESSLDIRFQLGFTRAKSFSPVAGSFDGQPGDTVGYFDTATNLFHLHTSNTTARDGENTVDIGLQGTGWAPVAAHFAGGATSTVGAFNAATQEWRLKTSNVSGPADITFTFGTGSKYDTPLAGNFRGDGTATVGVYNVFSGQVLIRLSNTAGPADISFTAGSLNQSPVVADWDRSGRASLAFFDHLTQQLNVRYTLDAGAPDRVIQITPSSISYTPIAGHWRIPTTGPDSPGYAWPTDTLANQRIAAGPVAAAYLAATQVPNLRSLLIVRNGKLVSEAYFHGSKASDGHDLHSCTKSITSALYGVALAEGTMTSAQFFGSIFDILPQYRPADPLDPKNGVTPAHLLTMSAGLQWDDGTATFTKWFAAPDSVKYVWDQPMVATPGTVWNYDSGLTHTAGRILTQLTGMELADYADAKIFKPLGIQAMRWDHDAQGHYWGSGGSFIKARDMARFGYLYLNRGLVDGKQIVPAAWVDATTKPVFKVGIPSRPNYYYGTGWWTDIIAGYQIYSALGWGGQWIMEVPALNMVIVVTSKGDVPGQMDGIEDGMILQLLNTILPAVSP